MSDRRAQLRRNCLVHDRPGLEIGPLASPLVLKSEGPILYADYVSAEELRAKSAPDPNVRVEDIVSVDFSLTDTPLAALSSRLPPLQYVVASHVFEHVPNPVGWLRELAALLEVGGLISLAIPDRRFTFDYLRSETTLAALLAYDIERLSHPSVAQLIDHYLNVSKVDQVEAWNSGCDGKVLERYHSLEIALYLAEKALRGEYVDCHCTVWTADSFLRLFPEVARLRALPLEIHEFHMPVRLSNEFIVQLRKTR